jgi:putative transposase
MSQSLSNILIHIVFSTKERRPFIQPAIEQDLHHYITGICEAHDCPVYQIGGMEDHIHILISLSRTISLSKLIGEIKANSSKWIKGKGLNYQYFAWQSGYGVFSIGQSGFQPTVHYIAQQKEHHKKGSFQEEFLSMLKKYQVSFDEKYLWD